MRGFLRRWLLLLAVCTGGLACLLLASTSGVGSAAAHNGRSTGKHASAGTGSGAASAGGPAAPSALQRAWSVDARKGIVELLGTADGSRVGWNRRFAEWGGLIGPHWWQSALAMLTAIRYAEQTNYRSPILEHVIRVTYNKNIWKPKSLEKFDFINQYMDDTVWWGLAWLNASEYELYYRHDLRDAARYLSVAETDAAYVSHRRQCGGIVWQLGSPSGTITNAEYIALTAELSQYRRTSSTFHDPGQADRWLSDARGTLRWLQRSRLVNLGAGTVRDRLASHRCHTLLGGPLAYTEGEVADGLVQIGLATNDPSYYKRAAGFLRYVLDPVHGFVKDGILQEHCESYDICTHLINRFDITAFKGIFMMAISDWTMATGSHEFVPFIRRQATAIVRNTIHGPAPHDVCTSTHSCQFAFSWSHPFDTTPVHERLITVGTQESALDALIAALS
jgi:Glycosyl hydrolase family 76